MAKGVNCFARASRAASIPLHLVETKRFSAWLKSQDRHVRNWLEFRQFSASPGRSCAWPGEDGNAAGAICIYRKPPKAGPEDPQHHPCYSFAGAAMRLPAGRYALVSDTPQDLAHWCTLGWGLARYRFNRYRSAEQIKQAQSDERILVWPSSVDKAEITACLDGVYLARDLINTPAGDLGPKELGDALIAIAKKHKATTKTIKGAALLKQNYPAVHAVGRAASRDPQLTELHWGSTRAPKVTLVGKGVIFDSGGLDIKSAAGMRLMKKDMGGAAAVIALANMIMAAKLKVRLRVLIPAVENAISGDAFRPGDVLPTRKGVFVEIGNTDAEGRLILCDALYEGAQDQPELLIDFATLTGAARVALGTELPALFSNDDSFAQSILKHGAQVGDPLWRMPLHQPYRRFLESKVADLNNISRTGPGGAITAALYLREFVQDCNWVHIDTMAYNDHPRPGHPDGGEALGVRAVFEALRARFG